MATPWELVFAAMAAGFAVASGWAAIPERLRLELRATRMPVPSHDKVLALWSNAIGDAVAVGAHGDVLALRNEDGAWTLLATDVESDLYAVSGGRGPGGSFMAVGAGGTIVECDADACQSLPRGTTQMLRGVAVGGG